MLAAVFIAALASSVGCGAKGYHLDGYPARSTADALDVMQQLMTGDEEYFDPAYLTELGQCWDDTHPDLRQGRNSMKYSTIVRKTCK